MFSFPAVKSSDGWTLATPMRTIFRPGSDPHRCRPRSRPQGTGCVLSDQTVVVKWTCLSREADIKLARQEAQLHFDEATDNFTPKCRNPGLGELTAEDGDHERRVLRIIVEQELQLLTKLSDPDELAVAFKGIVQCHHWLYETPKILHRDISASSLMFQRIDNTILGVLSDFDSANIHGSNEPPWFKLHTGSQPYMAADLLIPNPPKHLFRHDLESFLYVLVFLTCNVKGSELDKWIELDMAALKNSKESAVNIGFPPQKNELAMFYGWVARLTLIFAAGSANRNAHRQALTLESIGGPKPVPFDEATLGGAVTVDNFEAALDLSNLAPRM
ncbi:hypothetical protein C8R47DRAFT_1202918 [Mycena vitilis]|nr:hypothetical protein C8R47DRAFT_1202918 [Mycena vitilis]